MLYENYGKIENPQAYSILHNKDEIKMSHWIFKWNYIEICSLLKCLKQEIVYVSANNVINALTTSSASRQFFVHWCFNLFVAI